MQEHPFDAETAVSKAGENRFVARTSTEWWGAASPHGGHLAATGLRAIKSEVDDHELSVRSLSVQFIGRAEAGNLEIATETLHRGRSIAFVKAYISQAGRLIAALAAVLGANRPSPSLPDTPMPVLPEPSQLAGLPERHRHLAPPYMRNYEIRKGIGDQLFSGGAARTGGWVRPIPGRGVDDLLVTAYADVWGRSIFMTLDRPSPVPTVELTINYLGELRPGTVDGEGLCLVLFETTSAHDGYFREEGKIWSKDGVLLAACSQLGMLL